TSPTRTVRATRLRHAPRAAIISERALNARPPPPDSAATLSRDPVPVGDETQDPPDFGAGADGEHAVGGACLSARGVHRGLPAECGQQRRLRADGGSPGAERALTALLVADPGQAA